MGDRTTPMKFGPEWLRNLSREPTGTVSTGAPSATPAIRSIASNATASGTASSNATASAKVQLAKLRYGREEMLALFDPQTAEAPVELKSIELLYHSRGKSPYALNSNFEEDAREGGGIRNIPQIGPMSMDRFGTGRGRGYSHSNLARGHTVSEGRGRARTFARQTSSGRAPSWHGGAQRGYPGPMDDEPSSSRGLWNNGNGGNPPGIRGNPPGIRPTAEQADWANKMAYRRPRQNHTNWRHQPQRDEGEEWRSDGARRGQDKWDRDWSERSPQDKGWSTNRRNWGGDSNELPEWIVENAENCGTFDSTGAYFITSNDDSNIPKAQDSSHALSRSQTHGSMSHDFKQFAKRRFDATEVKFKKPADEPATEESGDLPSASNEGANAKSEQTREIPKIEIVRNKPVSQEEPEMEGPEMQDEAAALPIPREKPKYSYLKSRLASAQRNDLLSQTEERESSSEQGASESAMMASTNNNMRQQQERPAVNVPITTPRYQQILNLRNKLETDYKEHMKHQQDAKDAKDAYDMLDAYPAESFMGEEIQAHIVTATTQSAGIPNTVNSFANEMPNAGMQMRMMTSGLGMNQQQPTQTQPTSETNLMQPIGLSNSALNASLGLPIGTGSNMNMPMTTIPATSIQNPSVLSSNLQGLGTGNMQNMQVGGIQSSFENAMPGNNIQGLQPIMQTSNMNNNNMQSASGMPAYQTSSLFMASDNNMNNTGEMGNQGQQNMYPMHGLQQSASQGSFNTASLYNMMQPPSAAPHNMPMADLWYYEDPNKTIQGPFPSKEMFGWYHAGFFTPDLMVRRACESGLMPLASYGPMPFGSVEMLHSHFMAQGGFDMRQHENMMSAQQAGLGPDVESLWSVREPSAEDMWYQAPVQMPAPEQVSNVLNNLSMFFWDQPAGTTMQMPESLQDMKTEDEILAQMRATQSEAAVQNLTFICDTTISPEEALTAGTNIAPNLEELQKLIGGDIHRIHTPLALEPPAATIASVLPRTHVAAQQKPSEKSDSVIAKQQLTAKAGEAKPFKQPAKIEEKPKPKEAPLKMKAKKVKEEKKEEIPESKKEEKKIFEKRSDESSVHKNKREDKANKKDSEKEKKDWLRDGFTIVKGAERKDNKKKEKEDTRAAEEAERKRKEEEKRALEAEKNKTPEPVTRRQQLEQGQRQIQSLEQPKKAPWSAHYGHSSRDGLALSDIQRLEREKKLQQIKEQQHMMHIIAQQHAVAALRDQQEIPAGQLGWAKKKTSNVPGQNLAEIQAEARQQAAALVAAVASAAAREEKLPTPPPATLPWGGTNGGGFWDCPATVSGAERANDHMTYMGSSTSEMKSKKKVTMVVPKREPKKEISPSADFNTWCIYVLSNLRDASNIDVPTFVAFLRDIESPYEVKDYVKCYLGDTKEATDFARQFLERRSRMLRVGTVTPSDDLCSPAAALTPRTNSGSDYTEVKSKGNKKTKKNRMLKIDARILGFSVTASEDRINVGDIDTA